MTYLIVAHDLSVLERVCDRIAVMYLGQIMNCRRAEVSSPTLDIPIPSHSYQRFQWPIPRSRVSDRFWQGIHPTRPTRPLAASSVVVAPWQSHVALLRSRPCSLWMTADWFVVTLWKTTWVHALNGCWQIHGYPRALGRVLDA